jgi:hypothetical protein
MCPKQAQKAEVERLLAAADQNRSAGWEAITEPVGDLAASMSVQ